ncbi:MULTISPECIES: cytochrome b/b6 domain-containing protein [Vitreoscilla]|uniref:Cytochrome b/b6 domain-containing protein n=1 Tax=Vitreoscilla stercoraria TaxID=61 RepID=A0ABY4EFE8_VITST|nr:MULTISPECIES: cytochrome b/b6 domain-containing protein [Vitreoscilla]AUZ05059.1 putative cytochrome b [Vitreoscilla sp. C1]UOO93630.1 cytochrome b/b6 domain-containing protein [Vitreoscilla stercoraria]
MTQIHTEKVLVWDIFIRIFHWSMVAIVVCNLFLLEEGGQWHQYLGYAACILMLLRIVWGFIGSPYARFKDFFPTPSKFKAHFQAIRNKQADEHLGHNPMGALMIFALIAVVLGLGFTGWSQTMESPFYLDSWPADLHEWLVTVLQILVVLHIAAVMLMSVWTRTDLVGAMLTGRKKKR